MSYGYEIIFGVNWKCDFKKHLASLCQGDPPRSVLKTATGNRSDHHRSVINIRVIKLSSANKGTIHLICWQIFAIFDPYPKLYIPSTLNNSNETHTFMCLGRAGRFGQH